LKISLTTLSIQSLKSISVAVHSIDISTTQWIQDIKHVAVYMHAACSFGWWLMAGAGLFE
jgi:hypothetical protein